MNSIRPPSTHMLGVRGYVGRGGGAGKLGGSRGTDEDVARIAVDAGLFSYARICVLSSHTGWICL
jgi:hypothetical protein